MITQSPQPTALKPKASRIASELLSQGLTAVTTGQIAHMLGIPEDQVRQRLEGPRRRGEIVSPSRGLWVPVPPDRRLWGAPEPDAYLDAMMRHLRTQYYVGWLSAASLFGAAHQAPQVLQVATGKTIADRTVGRSRLHFVKRSRVPRVPRVTVACRTNAISVSSIGATMLDLMEDLDESGGLDNAATVIIELAEEHPSDYQDDLLSAARLHTVGCLRRVGWVLERVGGLTLDAPLAEVAAGASGHVTPLAPSIARTGSVDRTWMIDVNVDVEPDL